MLTIKNKSFVLLIFALLFFGCDDAIVTKILLAKRMSNLSHCFEGCTVVTGDSNVYWYNWNFIPGNVCNRGIGGTRINFVIDDIDAIAALNPARLIIWTGQNNNKDFIEDIQQEYDKLFDAIKKLSCPVYMISMHPYHNVDNENMDYRINDYLKAHNGEGYTLIDIYDDINACQDKCFFDVGHLSPTGFEVIKTRVLEAI